MADRSTVTAFAELALQFTGFRNVDLFSQGIYQIRARAHGARSGRAAVPFATSKAAADASVAAGSTANRDEVLPAHILDGSGDFCSPAFRVRYCDEEVILRTLGRLRIELSLDPAAADAADAGADAGGGSSWTLEDARRAMATRLHVVYGLSKDFCASGYRVGVLSTRNEQIVRAMDNVAYFCCVPGPMQFAVAEVLEDEGWVDAFLEENSANLRDAHAALTAILAEGNVPVVPSSAGMFVWVDLSAHMKAPTWEEEKRLWTACFEDEKTRLLMTPGRDCRHNKPGCFRMCFAAVKREALEVAARRLVDLLKRYE